ncbi:MAG: protein jag [Clostridiaceae bacterium]|nr:protein jag [Clostridiaceae bacterium]
MNNSVISEGKTTQEAIENGLKQLKVSKDKVDIKVLENENKKSFFSILTPRVVKVELILKENVKVEKNDKKIEKREEKPKKEYDHNIEDIEKAKDIIEKFLNDWLKKIDESIQYSIKIEDYSINIDIKGESSGLLIGYRGETLNALQTILSTIANRNFKDRIRIVLDIENYRSKREKILEELAEKIARTVLKNGKSITLEPMTAYERKIIHSKLQDNDKIETYSIGEGDNRRIVIDRKK